MTRNRHPFIKQIFIWLIQLLLYFLKKWPSGNVNSGVSMQTQRNISSLLNHLLPLQVFIHDCLTMAVRLDSHGTVVAFLDLCLSSHHYFSLNHPSSHHISALSMPQAPSSLTHCQPLHTSTSTPLHLLHPSFHFSIAFICMESVSFCTG